MASRTGLKALLFFAAAAGLVLAWGYWHSMTHAALNVRVDDYGMKTDRIAYGTPHDVTLVFRGPANEQLALARSVEPLGYIMALHPDTAIGSCEHAGARADHAACYRAYSAWSSTWAGKVRTADVTVGSCEVKQVPVVAHISNSEWLLWWVPLPHIGGVPRRYFDLVVRIDSRACAAVAR
jgi:hypothetical protein